MKVYFLDEFKCMEDYGKFIQYMLLKSDSFSLVYFRYNENEKMKKNVKKISDGLKPYKIYSKRTNVWPNTETRDDTHIYNYIMYLADARCVDILIQVPGIYEWDYPDAPMDLCFYKDGYCWLSITAHGHSAYLYTDNAMEVEELMRIGADLVYDSNIENTQLFWCRKVIG